jgi:hypothetical protein
MSRRRAWHICGAVGTPSEQLRLAPLDDSGTTIRKHFLQLKGMGVRDLHFVDDELYMLAGPTTAMNGEIRIFEMPAVRPLLAANHDPVRFESALTESDLLPNRRRTNGTEAFCDLTPALWGGKASWCVQHDMFGDDRKESEETVVGDLLRYDGDP